MDYKGHKITRGKPEKTPKGKRKGILDVYDENGELVNFFTYTDRNWLSLSSAKKRAKNWIDEKEK